MSVDPSSTDPSPVDPSPVDPSPVAYPRDLIGYGRYTPNPHWPDNARIAVQFVINYEEGGENCILHGDPASEAFLSETVGAEPLKGVRNINMESMYEYGSRAGFWRLHRLFTQRHARDGLRSGDGNGAQSRSRCCHGRSGLGNC